MKHNLGLPHHRQAWHFKHRHAVLPNISQVHGASVMSASARSPKHAILVHDSIRAVERVEPQESRLFARDSRHLDAPGDGCLLGIVHEVHLVQEHNVRKCQLLHRLLNAYVVVDSPSMLFAL